MNEKLADIEAPYLTTLHAVRALRELLDDKLDEISGEIVSFIESPAEECMRIAERTANHLRDENVNLREDLRAMTHERDSWMGMYRLLESKQR